MHIHVLACYCFKLSFIRPPFAYYAYSSFVSAAAIYSIGGHFRKPVYANWRLVLVVLMLFALIAVLLLSEPNTFTALFHIASNSFNEVGTPVLVWATYQQEGGAPSGPMSHELRVRLGVLVAAGIVSCVTWELLIVQGPVRSWVYRKFGDHRQKATIPL
jgi:hypothetical protein